MSKTKAFLLSVFTVFVVYLISVVMHVSHQLGVAGELCVALCTIYFLTVSTWFWSGE